MSHFTVAVLTEDGGKSVEELLAAFHEFECTGVNDEYVQDFDITEEMLEEYANSTYSKCVHKETGKMISTYSDVCYREPTPDELIKIEAKDTEGISYSIRDWGDGKERRAMVNFVPEGYELKEVKANELYPTFREYLIDEYNESAEVAYGEVLDLEDRHKYNYFITDENKEVVKVCHRTNPNAKWDWYQVGGRWQGMLKLKKRPLLGNKSDKFFDLGFTIGEIENFVRVLNKDGAKFDKLVKKYGTKGPELVKAVGMYAQEVYPAHEIGEPSLLSEKHEFVLGYADKARIKDIDFSIDKESEAYKKAERFWELYIEGQPALNESDEELLRYNFYKREYFVRKFASKEAYTINQVAFSTYAVLTPDGEWHSSGDIGWFGFSSAPPEEEGEWCNSFYEKFIKNADQELWLTVVDCHI